jgi:hypothetical protein
VLYGHAATAMPNHRNGAQAETNEPSVPKTQAGWAGLELRA